ncbi:MAG TPA: helix-turn-helix transcriptional regulator, partial [Solirubrobacter sp.]|nr:helix-turn-helix transcriptional regulator [Solirubrobacter sp.]
EAAGWARQIPGEAGGRRVGLAGAIVARAQATALLAGGDPVSATRAALAGAEAGRAASVPIWAARCRIVAGESLVVAGRSQTARRELRAAAAELDACGAWRDRDAALQVLRRLGDRPRTVGGPVSGDGDRLGVLTPREREVAVLVGEGLTNAQIALRLQLSEKTVEKHVSRVLAKLGVASRTGIVRLLAHTTAS